MSYTKTNWQTGDVVTADKLNHAENGIELGSMNGFDAIIKSEYDEATDANVSEFIFGSYDDLKTKIENKLCPNICVKYTGSSGSPQSYNNTFLYDYNFDGDNPFIYFYALLATEPGLVSGNMYLGGRKLVVYIKPDEIDIGA